MTRRRWFLIEKTKSADEGVLFIARGTDYVARHHVESLEAFSTACGIKLRKGFGCFVQHFPKEQSPRCAACLKALRRAR